jgi:epoxyqueuosine reductase QueG
MGPYSVQGLMNTHLDHMSYEMARFLEDLGYDAIPIAASNIWRYRNYKNLNAVFAPDMSHIYAAVTAGLTELGYHGISMSPEFGPRNRFVSIITTAPLDPTPLMPGDTMCDNCMQCGACRMNCPVGAIEVSSGVGCAAAIVTAMRRGNAADARCECS